MSSTPPDSDSLLLTGTVTDVGGSPLDSVTVIGINETQGTIQEITTTDSAGEYTIAYPAGDEAHVLFEHDDGAIQHVFESKPFIDVVDTSPPADETLLAHWDFSKVDASDGETYSTVPDLSGNGHALTGGGASHTTTGINGLPSAYFDASGDVLYGPHTDQLDLRGATTQASVYIVYQSLDTDNYGYLLAQAGDSNQLNHGFSIQHHRAGREIRVSVGGNLASNATIFDTNPHMIGTLIDRPNTSATVSWDGTAQSLTPGADTDGTYGLLFGARHDSGGGELVFHDGYIGEVLVYDGYHDTATHDEVIDYLSRWIP